MYREAAELKLYLTVERGCSSLYKPNLEFIRTFSGTQGFEIDKTISVNAISLDELIKKERLENIDFIKIDVQGAELDVLKGGEKFLSENILGMELEVEFQQQYLEQPLFSEVDDYVRNKMSLEIQDLKKYYWKHPEGLHFGSAKGKLIFGEALYLRSPENLDNFCRQYFQREAKDKLLIAVLIGVVYGFFDYSLAILERNRSTGIIKNNEIDSLVKAIKVYGKGLRYNGKLSVYISEIFRLFYRMFQPTEGGGSIGQPLGSRKKFGIFY